MFCVDIFRFGGIFLILGLFALCTPVFASESALFSRAESTAKREKKMLCIFFTATPQTDRSLRERFAATPRRIQKTVKDKNGKPMRISFLERPTAAESNFSFLDICKVFESNILQSEPIRDLLENVVLVTFPIDSPIFREARFAPMSGWPGIAQIDYRDAESPEFGQVVGLFPFLNAKAYDTQQLRIILTLPPGSITQRSLIYAVRAHPERPESSDSTVNELLQCEAEAHCREMARTGIQGHQGFDVRFQRINQAIPGAKVSEVCAESWPDQAVLEAAIDCVHSWRSSPGHWNSVRGKTRCYGYDMRRSSKGIWYATGLFVE